MSDYGVISLKDFARLRYTVRAYRQTPTLCAEHLVAFARPLLGVISCGLDPSKLYESLDAINTAIDRATPATAAILIDARRVEVQRIAQAIADAFVAAETAGEGEGFEDTRIAKDLSRSIVANEAKKNGGRPVLVAALPEHGGSR